MNARHRAKLQIAGIIASRARAGTFLSLDGIDRILGRKAAAGDRLARVSLDELCLGLRFYKARMIAKGCHYTQNPKSPHYEGLRGGGE